MPELNPASGLAALPAPGDVAAGLRAALSGWTGVDWLAKTGSTNADVQEWLRAGATGPLLVGAHLQTAGRGRAGRAWQTRPGDALLFSCGWRVGLPRAALPPLSLVAGIAVCEALRAVLGEQADGGLTLKWPNDIQWNGAKLAGILVETSTLPGSPEVGLVIGMGLNVRGAQALSQELGRAVADWSGIGTQADPGQLVAATALAWHDALHRYAQSGFAAFQDRYARWDALRGLPVRVIDAGRLLLEGTAHGVDDSGRLLIDDGDALQPVTVGDVSVRAVAATPDAQP